MKKNMKDKDVTVPSHASSRGIKIGFLFVVVILGMLALKVGMDKAENLRQEELLPTASPYVSAEPTAEVFVYFDNIKKSYNKGAFEALSSSERAEFVDTFEKTEDFYAWLSELYHGVDVNLPEEHPGPIVLTWDEFMALGNAEQEAYFESFESPESFEAWMAQAQIAPQGVQEELTWDEFMALGNAEQEAYFESFESPESFEAWMAQAQIAPQGVQEELTWDEFMALGNAEQEAYFESFESPESFEAWMEQAKAGDTQRKE